MKVKHIKFQTFKKGVRKYEDKIFRKSEILYCSSTELLTRVMVQGKSKNKN